MIKKARFEKKISQKELARLLSVTQSYISKIENRKTKTLSILIILKLSEILELDPVDVFKYLAEL